MNHSLKALKLEKSGLQKEYLQTAKCLLKLDYYLRVQSAIFQSSESHSFIRTPEIVLE